MKISDLLKYSAYRAPERPALWFDERMLSYRKLYDQVCRLANGMRRLAASGDRVAILSENHPEYVFCSYGVPLAAPIFRVPAARLPGSRFRGQRVCGHPGHRRDQRAEPSR